MKTVLFLTASYPYNPGEQFIEDEIKSWAKISDVNLILVPMVARGDARAIPSGVAVDLTLASRNFPWDVLLPAAKSVISPIFWREIFSIKDRRADFFVCAAVAFKAVVSLYRTEECLLKIKKKSCDVDLIYSYWNDIQAYAAVLMKRRKMVKNVVSRIHGYDLYPARRRCGFMPLKGQFLEGFDFICPVSDQGAATLVLEYRANPKRVKVRRLGVPIPIGVCVPSERETLTIVSVSSCIAVKRVDKIIYSISEAIERLDDLEIRWIHIGSGPLFDELKCLASKLIGRRASSFEFKGVLKNSEVRDFFAANPVDLFVNASESEGIPVSIMEALSYGVPSIAPNVGGISELIDDSCGVLLSENPSASELADAIVSIKEKCKDLKFRTMAREKIIGQYSAEANYDQLVEELVGHAGVTFEA